MGPLRRLTLGALCLASAGAQSGTRCTMKESDVPEAATATLQAYKDMNRDFPRVVPMQIHSDVRGNAEGSDKDVVFEGWVRPEQGYYRMVPGLGLGIEMKNDTLLYVCLDLKKPDSESRMIAYFLKAKGLKRSRFEIGKPSARVTASNVQLRPLTEGVHLIGEIPILGPLIPAFIEKGVDALTSVFYNLFTRVTAAGVERLELTPTEAHFDTGVEIAGQRVGTPSRSVMQFESPWMRSNYDPSKDPPPADLKPASTPAISAH